MIASQPKRTAASTATLTGASPMTAGAHSRRAARGTGPAGHGHDASARRSCSASSLLAPRGRSRPREPEAKIGHLRLAVRRAKLIGARAQRFSCRESLRTCGRFCRVSASRLGPIACARARAASIRRSRWRRPGGRPHVRHGAQRRQVLDRLVRRAVLAKADGIVRHHIDDADAHQRRDAHGRAGIIGEDQEGRAGRDEAAMQRHAVHGRRHAVLADAVMDVAAGKVLGVIAVRSLVLVLLDGVRSAEPSDQFGHRRRDDLERQLATPCGSRRSAARLASCCLECAHGRRRARRHGRPPCAARIRARLSPSSALERRGPCLALRAGPRAPALRQASQDRRRGIAKGS